MLQQVTAWARASMQSRSCSMVLRILPGQTLASIRRAMNYFKGSSTGTETADFVCFPCVLTSTAAGIAVQHLDTGKEDEICLLRQDWPEGIATLGLHVCRAVCWRQHTSFCLTG